MRKMIALVLALVMVVGGCTAKPECPAVQKPVYPKCSIQPEVEIDDVVYDKEANTVNAEAWFKLAELYKGLKYMNNDCVGSLK